MTNAFWENCLHAWVWMVIGFGCLFSAAGVPGLDAGAGLCDAGRVSRVRGRCGGVARAEPGGVDLVCGG
jgi:hypothetical protein